MSTLSNSSSLKAFNDKLNQELLLSYLRNEERVADMIPLSIKTYVITFLQPNDITLCIAVLEGNSEQLRALPGVGLLNRYKAISELLAQFPNTHTYVLCY